MAVERFPVEAGHIMLFARAIGDPNPAYYGADDRRDDACPRRRRSCRRAPSSTRTTSCARSSASPGSARAATPPASSGAEGGRAAGAAAGCTPSSTTSTTARCGAGDVLTADRPRRRDLGEAGPARRASSCSARRSPSTATRTASSSSPPAASACGPRRSSSRRSADGLSVSSGGRQPRSCVLVDDLTRTQIVQYAGASGDYNPLHTDERFTTRGRRLPVGLRPRHAHDGHDRPGAHRLVRRRGAHRLRRALRQAGVAGRHAHRDGRPSPRSATTTAHGSPTSRRDRQPGRRCRAHRHGNRSSDLTIDRSSTASMPANASTSSDVNASRGRRWPAGQRGRTRPGSRRAR